MAIKGQIGTFSRDDERAAAPGHGPVLLSGKLKANDGKYPVGLLLTRAPDEILEALKAITAETIGTGDPAATEVTGETIGTGEAAATEITAEVIGTGDASQTLYTGFFANDDIEPGSVEITATVGAAPATMTDDGAGRLAGAAGAGTVDYETGLFVAVFSTAPDGGPTDVLADYNHTPPAASFADTLAETPIVPGTVSVTDGVETFTDNGEGVLAGDAGGSGTVNYDTGAISVTFDEAPGEAVDVDVDYSHTPPAKSFSATLANLPIEPGTVAVTDGVEEFEDNGKGVLVGDAGGFGTVDYDTGAISVAFDEAPGEDDDVDASYYTRISGVLDEKIDTAEVTAGLYVVHGTVRREFLKIGKTSSVSPDEAFLMLMQNRGIYPVG